MDLYKKVVKYVDISFKGKSPHLERTVYWIEKLIPTATEVHKIAAYAHDMERAFRNPGKVMPESFLDQFYLKDHPEEGAKIMGKFLEKNGANKATINKVRRLISKHEVGGDEEQNALMDADSISFFETNAQHFVKERTSYESYEKIKEKLDWMFNRISREEHKKFARENYENWSKELEKYIK